MIVRRRCPCCGLSRLVRLRRPRNPHRRDSKIALGVLLIVMRMWLA